MAERKTVLAIDDDPDILDFVKSVLSPHYEVRTGYSGQECLELIATHRPDAIVLDVIMAHLGDGLDCVRSIKENPATQGIPVIMLTSVNQVYDYRSQIDESFYAHDRWLDKPITAQALLKTVREVLGE